MKKLYYLSAALTMLISQVGMAQSSATLIKKVDAQPGKLVIPYEKYKLPNGLTVIVSEDHSDPIVHVEVTYHVGSNRETMKRTGFAHFFEHMMFQGSENVADEEHFKIVQGSGGQMNGTTNRDRTNYFETVPSNMLETALWLEADRMGFLLPAFSTKKFETQRATVKNEKDQSYGDGYGMLPEVMDQLLYPYAHPYSWQTIGYTDDLDSADASDLQNFFMKWYGPNNATVVVSGDVNTQEVLKMVEKYFGSINRGPEPPALAKKPIVLEETKIKTVTSKIYAPLTSIIYPSVYTFHKDQAALDVLSSLLGGGKSSVLYKHFIESEVALQAACYNYASEIAGEFTFQLVTYPAARGGLTEKEMRETLAKALLEFETKGINDEDLKRVKQDLLAAYNGIIETIAYKSAVLSEYEMLTGSTMTLDKDLDRYRTVTKEEVMRVFNTYIKGKNYACLNILPDPKLLDDPYARIKQYESVNPYASEKADKSGYANLAYKPNVDANGFDRKRKPVISTAKAATVPEFFQTSFDNGLKIIGTKSNETPRIHMSISIRGGHLFETGKVKNGSAAFLATMMNEGTTTKTPLEVENRLRALGSGIYFSGNEQSFSIYVECFKDSMAQTMALLEDMFYNPGYSEKEFKLNKKAILQSIELSNLSPPSFGRKKFNQMIYGENNPIGIPSLSEYSVASKITAEDAKNYKDNYLSPNLTTISIVGDIDQESVVKHLSFLKRWQNKNLVMPSFNEFPPLPKTQVYMVNHDGAKQTSVTIGYRSLPYDIEGDFFRANIMNFVLGGNFNSRLNSNLREDKGWTYGIYSGFSPRGMSTPGMFIVSAGIKTAKTDSAVAEILKIIKNYVENGITDEELEFTKRSLLGSDALNYESPNDKLGFLSQIVLYNLDRNYNEKRDLIIKNITKEEINAIARKQLLIDNLIIVCVGDDVRIQEGLEKLGLGKVKVIKM